MLRKIVTIQDLTLCLDKMDASGKIEVYQVLKIYLNLIQLFIYKKEKVIPFILNIGSCFISMFFGYTFNCKLSQ